jgi:predicted HAD superfamily Cof-like phosphohydrolase
MEIDVKIFLDACDQKPSVENTLLYKDLIVEEFAEFIEAFNMEDDVEQLDACMDMIWVILGYCHMKKFDIRGGWDEVAKSNLCKIDSNTDKVIRREDGKILKPEGWKPPDLTKFV